MTDPGEAVFSLNGEERGRITEIEPPPQTLAFVDRFLRELGEGLRPGDLVIAGALAPAAQVAAGDVARAEVDRVGSVSLRFGV